MVSRKVVLHFPPELVNQPIISETVRRYKLGFNILKASIAPQEGGLLVLELQGEKEDLGKALNYLKDRRIGIQALSKDITRDEDRCVHCGVCVAICPSEALFLNQANWEVEFFTDKCVACELCVRGCPYGAMEVKF